MIDQLSAVPMPAHGFNFMAPGSAASSCRPSWWSGESDPGRPAGRAVTNNVRRPCCCVALALRPHWITRHELRPAAAAFLEYISEIPRRARARTHTHNCMQETDMDGYKDDDDTHTRTRQAAEQYNKYYVM